MARWALTGILCAGALLAPRLAHAQAPSADEPAPEAADDELPAEPTALERARRLERKAREAFDAEDFEAAAEAYAQAFTFVPDGRTKYNEGFAWSQAERSAPAADAYTEALTLGLPDELATATLERLAALKLQVGTVSFDKPLDATISVGHVKERALPTTVHLPPGKHVARLRYPDGAEAERSLEVRANAKQVITFPGRTPPPPPGPAPPPRLPPSPSPPLDADGIDPAVIAGLAVGGVALGAGAVTIGLGVATLDRIDDFRATDNRDAELRDEAVRLKQSTNIMLGVSAALAVTGATLLTWGWWPDDDVELSVGPGAVNLRGSF